MRMGHWLQYGLVMALSGILAGPSLAATIYKYRDANGVVTYSDQRTTGAQVFSLQGRKASAQPQPRSQQKSVQLLKQRQGTHEVLVLQNDLYAPVEVRLNLELQGNTQALSRQRRWVVPARSRKSLLTLSPQVAGRPLRYRYRYSYALGDPSILPKPYRYPLPWRGGPFRLTQGPNGKYSHFSPKGRYAQDIAMPVGTPILAARGGVVVETRNSQAGRAGNPSGNFVRVLHDDSTMSVYLHLQRGSVQVREGQRIRVGQLLARSGNTGRSTGPHLHFVVQRNVGLAVESIPFEFSQPVNSLPNFAMGGD